MCQPLTALLVKKGLEAHTVSYKRSNNDRMIQNERMKSGYEMVTLNSDKW
jgi:hypothetical protein